jgi:hypothetical protein
MRARSSRLVAPLFSVLAVLAGCADPDAPTAADTGSARMASASTASAGRVSVCHKPASEAAILEIAMPALAAHLAHGDYVTSLQVDPGAAAVDGVRFGTIGGAVAAARAGRLARGELVTAACRITVTVPAGTVEGVATGSPGPTQERFPIVVDVPDLTLRGAMVMALDANGRATGQAVGGTETILQPLAPLPVVALSSTPIILVNAHPGGSAGNGFTVEGFVFRSGHDPLVDAGGQGVLALRSTRLTIHGNRFEPGFTESIDLRASDADVLQNHLEGTAGTCDVCLAAPGTYRAIGNRLLAGGIPGIGASGMVNLPLPAGVEPFTLPATAEVWAEIRNNEVRDHRRVPVGVGIRVDALGIGAPTVFNTVHADIRDNLLVNNRFGMIVHAAFPVANSPRHSDVDVTLGGNVFEQSCQAKLLVSLSRHTTALGLTANPWLLGSTFRIDLGGNLTWDEAWYGHAAGFGNTLVVDGQTIPNGFRQFYNATQCVGG